MYKRKKIDGQAAYIEGYTDCLKGKTPAVPLENKSYGFNPTGKTVCELRQIMNARSISVAELSERSGVSRSQIYKYMRGERIPSWETANRLGIVLEVSPNIIACFETKLVHF